MATIFSSFSVYYVIAQLVWYKLLKEYYERETSFFIGGVLQIRNFKLSHVSEICLGNVFVVLNI